MEGWGRRIERFRVSVNYLVRLFFKSGGRVFREYNLEKVEWFWRGYFEYNRVRLV